MRNRLRKIILHGRTTDAEEHAPLRQFAFIVFYSQKEAGGKRVKEAMSHFGTNKKLRAASGP